MALPNAAVKPEVPVLHDVRGFFGEAWQFAATASESLDSLGDHLRQLYDPPAHLLTLLDAAKLAAAELRVSIERTRTAAVVGVLTEPRGRQ